jgi:DNA-binding MarR family transcriptional regulator
MEIGIDPDRHLEIFRETIIGMVRREGRDLSARQFGVLLICYLEEGPHTVRGLSSRLNVPKPGITRVLDRLTELGFVRRGSDPRDLRSVLVQRTRRGDDFLGVLRGLLAASATAQAEINAALPEMPISIGAAAFK